MTNILVCVFIKNMDRFNFGGRQPRKEKIEAPDYWIYVFLAVHHAVTVFVIIGFVRFAYRFWVDNGELRTT